MIQMKVKKTWLQSNGKLNNIKPNRKKSTYKIGLFNFNIKQYKFLDALFKNKI